jgi:hypothetical protein
MIYQLTIKKKTLSIAFGIERTGRSKALGYGALGMSLFLWIVGAIFVGRLANTFCVSN